MERYGDTYACNHNRIYNCFNFLKLTEALVKKAIIINKPEYTRFYATHVYCGLFLIQKIHCHKRPFLILKYSYSKIGRINGIGWVNLAELGTVLHKDNNSEDDPRYGDTLMNRKKGTRFNFIIV
ncbi:hypothetical protein NCCP28_42980 [Niallia sp. NCCP-28]|nr:hypothetical protein NCCP28_42980 [Niallia sp. NCCP-28]